MPKTADSPSSPSTLSTTQPTKTLKQRQRKALLYLFIGISVSIGYGAIFFQKHWPSPEKATLETVSRATSQELLHDIAIHNADTDVYRAALEKLDDEALLMQIALGQNGKRSIQAALKLKQPASLKTVASQAWEGPSRVAILQITDQGLLETIALNRRVHMARSAALRLKDPAAVRRVFDGVSSWDVRLAAARATHDLALLKTIAMSPKSTNGRAAVDVLKTQPAILRDIAIHAPESSRRMRAIELLTEPDIASVVLKTSHAREKEEMIPRLTDPAILGHLAQTETLEWNARYTAIERIEDQNVLSRLAQSDLSVRTRSAATRRITDQTILRQLAETSAEPQVARDAICQLTDIEILKELAQNGADDIRPTARQRLAQLGPTDADFVAGFLRARTTIDEQLATIALANNSRRWNQAVDRINSQPVLLQIAMHDNQSTRIRAINRMTDQSALKKIVVGARIPFWCRVAAIERITDQEWLADLLLSPPPLAGNMDSLSSSVIRSITDQNLLTKIAIDPRSAHRFGKYMNGKKSGKVTDPVLAKKIALESPDPVARRWGAKYTTDQETLTQLGLKYLDSRRFTNAIAPNLTDRTLLLRIATETGYSESAVAEIRLAELDRMAAKNKDAP